MSSSSSLAAARRRRVGGQSQPPQQQQQQRQQQQPPNPPNGGNGIPSPFVLLQQHNAKIRVMEETIKEMVSNKSNSSNLIGDENQNQQLDINTLSDIVMSRIESTMDLKAFYDNDQRLSSEIELLQKTNESQQITLNSLNTTLHYIIQNLKLSGPLSFTQTDVNSDINSDINSVNVVGYSDETEIITGDGDENIYSSMIVDGSTGPDFPDSGKSVIINEVANEIREFTPMDEDEESNCTELENPPVD